MVVKKRMLKNKKIFYISLTIFLCFSILSCERAEEKLLREAHNYYKEKNYETAIITYLKLLDKNSKSKYAPFAQFEIGNIYNFNLNRYHESVIAYQKAVSYYPDSEYSFRAQYEISEIYNKKFNEKYLAIIEYERLFKYKSMKKEFPKIHLRIIDCYVFLKKYDEAIYELGILQKEFPKYKDNEYVLFKKGLILYQKSDFKSAKDIFESFLGTYPESKYYLKALYWHAQTLGELKFYKEALENYNILLEKGYKEEIIKEKIEKTQDAIKEEKRKKKKTR